MLLSQEKASKQEVEDLVQEMKIMQEIGSHPNVVTILGVCVEHGKQSFALGLKTFHIS